MKMKLQNTKIIRNTQAAQLVKGAVKLTDIRISKKNYITCF